MVLGSVLVYFLNVSSFICAHIYIYIKTVDLYSAAGAESNLATPGPLARGRSTKHRLQNFSTAMESIQADADPVELEDEDVP